MTTSSRVTTSELKSILEQLKTRYRTPEMDAAVNEGQHNVAVEELKLLSQQRICPIPKGPELLGISYPEIKEEIERRFDNPNTMLALACVADMLFFPSTLLSVEEKVHELITEVKKIGAESVAGVVMAGNLGNAPNLLVLKSPQDPSDFSLLHELFVGIFCTNLLRRKIPNFAYIYGGFKCSSPILNGRGAQDVVTWCKPTESPVQYILLENITPAVSMREYIETCTAEQFLNQYLQVLYALRTAFHQCEFTHYDLHDENVLIREVPNSPFSIPYETERGEIEYLATDRIATIIDYGFTFVRHQGRAYGHWLRIPYGVFPTNPFPLHAAYKLLLFSMMTMNLAGNVDGYAAASEIFRFFDTVDRVEDALKEQRPMYYSLQMTRGIRNASLDDLIKYIREHLPTPFLRPRPSTERVLGCQEGDVCMTLDQVLNSVRRELPGEEVDHLPPGPRTLLEFVDLIALGNETRNSQMVSDAIENFRPIYPVASDQAIKEIQSLRDKLTRQLGQVGMTYLFPREIAARALSSEDLRLTLSLNTINRYRQFVMNYFELLSTADRYVTNMRTLLIAAPIYQDVEMEEFIQSELASYDELREVMINIREVIIRDFNTLRDAWRRADLSNFWKRREVRWLRQDLPTYIPYFIRPIPEVEMTATETST